MISILIANWNSGDRLRGLCASIPDRPDVEIRVCDNASADGSADDLPDRVHLERPGRNLGFGGALNRLAVESSGDILLCLNPDCTLFGDTLDVLVSFYEAHPEVDIVGLSLLDADRKPQPRYAPRPLPTLGSLLLEVLLPLGLRGQGPRAPASGPVEHIAGAALSLRRAAFERLGGFDEQFHPAWFEDVDLSRRARDAGLLSWHCAEARVGHEGGYSREALGYAGLMPVYYGNLLRYAQKHLGGFAVLSLRAGIGVGMVLRMGVCLVLPRPSGTGRREALAAYRGALGVALSGADRGHHPG